MEDLNYGNWIHRKVLWLLGMITLGLGILTVLPIPVPIRIVFGSLGFGSLISLLYPLYSYYMFSPEGGNLQEKFYSLILKNLENPDHGKILDIGTGNGILAIKAAMLFPTADVTGVDYWGKDWEYSKAVSEQNARIAKVSERIIFCKGNAAALNYPDGTFDAVVSNLTFHEVKSVKRKSDILREALRVVKPGGNFVFIDQFYDESYYSDTEEFEVMLRGLKLTQITLKPLNEVLAFPKLLRHSKALGKTGIIFGKK